MQRSEREATEEAFRAAARALFISGETIDGFVASATPGQLSACRSMLEAELVHRDRAKRQRLLRQARFPVPKSFDGFDWSNVSFPDGWGREDMLSLSFMERAEDLVFYDGQGEDPRRHRRRHGCGLRGAPRAVLADGPAGAAAGQGQARGHAGQVARRRGQGEAPGSGRVRLRALRRGRGEAAVPGDAREPREEERDIHHQRRVRQVGYRLRRQQARCGDRRPVMRHGRPVGFGGPSHRLEESLMLGKSGR